MKNTKGNLEVYLSTSLLTLFFILQMKDIVYIQNRLSNSEWVMGDWLINYSNGFIRRGLSGEIFKVVAKCFNANIAQLITNFKLIVYLLIAIFSIFIAFQKKAGLIDLVFFIAPWAHMFPLNYSTGGGRKEVVLILFYILFVFYNNQDNKKYHRKNDYKEVIFIMPLMVLLHEGLFFFLQYFFIFAYLKEEKMSMDVKRNFFIAYSLSFFFVVISFLFRGTEGQSQLICNDVLESGLPPGICSGAIAAIGGFSYKFGNGFWRVYVPIFLLCTITMMCYTLFLTGLKKKKCMIALVLCIVPTFPLYVVAMDWGRWVYITMLLWFNCFFSLKEKDISVARLSSPLLIAFILLAILYVTSWVIPHYTHADSEYIFIHYPDDWIRVLIVDGYAHI